MTMRKPIPGLLKVEFHAHTLYSKDSLLSPERLVHTARRKGIDRLVVTDHNTIAGARAAQAIDPQLIIVGEEIMTQKGELLAAFVTGEIPAGLPPQDAIARLRDQNAFISVSHPFDVHRSGHWQPQDLLAIMPLVDAIETFNARCLLSAFNQQALEFALSHAVPGTAGSDAHTAWELGRAVLLLDDFHDAASLKQALPSGLRQGGASPAWVHLASRYAVLRKKRFAKNG